MRGNKIVKVSLYNGIFSVDRLPPGVELHLTDEDESVCNEKSYPGGVRRAKYLAHPGGLVIETTLNHAPERAT